MFSEHIAHFPPSSMSQIRSFNIREIPSKRLKSVM